MGSSASSNKCIYLDIQGKKETILFSSTCSNQDIHELICQCAEVRKTSKLMMKSREGAVVPLTPNMPQNTRESPYVVTIVKNTETESDAQAMTMVLGKVADQFNKAFRVDELRNELDKRLNMIEKRLELESLKTVEIEKCKKDIGDVRDQVWQQSKKIMNRDSISSPLPDETWTTTTNGVKFVSMRKMPSFEKYTLSHETVEYLKKPTFDMWHWEPNEMLSLLEHMFHELELVHEFNMNPITLKRWLLCIQANYRNNPFHNFRHCFCVAQMMYGMINLCQLSKHLPREDLGILIVAAICHDLDHPGYNNTYQINARTELAIRYNDISPLENHHCAVAFQILSNPETNIFGNVNKEDFTRIRKGMTMLILATDMARHGEILENFKKNISEGFDFNSKEHTDTMKMVLIKCCDISNEVRPMEVSEPWVDCLLEEYFNQSDREKIEGLPVAPFMDREKVTKPTAQIGFIKFVLIPMFEAVSKIFGDLHYVFVEPLQQSLKHYNKLKEEAVKAESQKQDETKTENENKDGSSSSKKG